jgi:ABC-type lipoprotein export system ATPase subunit
VTGLTVTDGQRRTLLDLPTLSVSPGRSLGISGPSGAGKTTLLHALAGLIPVHEGSIFWGATDMTALSDAQRTRFRASHMGLVFQTAHLFDNMSALDNAAIAAGFGPRTARAAIRAAARDQLDRLGITTESRHTVAHFSGGERQRVGVARALANRPAIVLADEPTASLDRAAADRLTEDLLRFTSDGGTLIVVIHDPVLLNRMNHILLLADGMVAA